MDDETKLLLLGPQDEEHLPSIFAGLLDCEMLKLEEKSNSVFADHESEAEQMHVASLLDLLPVQHGWRGTRKYRKRRKSCWANARSKSKVQYGWGGHKGPRKYRKKSISCWAEISHLFGGRTTFEGRKNIKRWTSLEAEMLVEGVSNLGLGNWTSVKRDYFGTSFRNPVHLKDKWRDFVRACGIKVGSKKKVKAQRATLEIIKGLKAKIRLIYRKHAAQNRRAH